ncbi:unnamed protein product, partial [Iphiclides podalirius]
MKAAMFLLISAALHLSPIRSTKSSTRPMEARIKSLKEKLRAEIERKGNPNYSVSYDGDYSEEVDGQRDFWLDPIVSRERKRHRHKRPASVAAVNETVKPPAKTKRRQKVTTCKGHNTRSPLRTEHKEQKTTAKSRLYMINPLDIFYRRDLDQDVEWKWAHCQDMITPYLTGIKKEPEAVKKVTVRDPLATRLFHLLSVNTTDYTKEDIFSVLYQISKLQLRLFQWDVMPMRLLLNTLTKGHVHTFRNLKRGMKALFEKWRLALDNTTNILQSTRIVRPPCTVTSRYSGSTKSQKVSWMIKDWTAKSTTPCIYRDGCDERK